MAKFPNPPGIEALKSISPVTCELEAGTRIFRIFKSAGRHSLHQPVHWNSFRHYGPTTARFDHHLCNRQGEPFEGMRGILYGAVGREAIPTCLAEVYQDTRIIDQKARAPVLCAFTLTDSLTLLDLSGAFATRIGASMAINSGPRDRARRWSVQLYEAYPHIHGIAYSSSMYANQPAVALFERAAFALPERPDAHRQLEDPALDHLLVATAKVIGYGLIPHSFETSPRTT